MRPSKGVQKNMLKWWNFIENKICHVCFDNYLRKLFQTKILKSSNGQIFLKVLLMFALWLKLKKELIKMILLNSPSIFTYLPLNFKNYNVSIYRDTYWTQSSNKDFLLTILVKSIIMVLWRALITPLTCLTDAIN